MSCYPRFHRSHGASTINRSSIYSRRSDEICTIFVCFLQRIRSRRSIEAYPPHFAAFTDPTVRAVLTVLSFPAFSTLWLLFVLPNEPAYVILTGLSFVLSARTLHTVNVFLIRLTVSCLSRYPFAKNISFLGVSGPSATSLTSESVTEKVDRGFHLLSGLADAKVPRCGTRAT